MTRADNRLRVHLWPHRDGAFSYSLSPTGPRQHRPHATAGTALDAALGLIGRQADVVVIIEPPT